MKDPTRGSGDVVEEDQFRTEHQLLNMGPSHPATHGTVKMLLELDGETIISIDVQVGYLHRGPSSSSVSSRTCWSRTASISVYSRP